MQFAVEERQGFAQRTHCAVGQTAAEVAIVQTMRVRGDHLAMFDCNLTLQELPDEVARRTPVARHAERQPFVFFLIINTIQHRAVHKILGRNAHQKRTVGVGLVALVLAHAVGDNRALLARGSHHRAARTHAEGVNTTVFDVHHAFVRGWRKEICDRTVLHPVDVALQMLHAHPDGERLRLHQQAFAVQHADGVAGGMS